MAKRQRAASVRPDQSFKGRQFTSEVILWAVRWYLMFPVSYRDLELMLADRGVEVDHTTIFRWIQAYAPELEKRIRPHLRPSNGSWRDHPESGGASRPPTSDGEKLMRRETGLPATVTFFPFRSPPRFWTVSLPGTARARTTGLRRGRREAHGQG